ncbi:hypothetical protein R1sor_001425 [Riccia sorocarpa]|uniref:Reverse transcriptase n=1 Tax=Riccia sorocarpa TaxID=122646 RepID=A0ABD3GVZ1_9MARC
MTLSPWEPMVFALGRDNSQSLRSPMSARPSTTKSEHGRRWHTGLADSQPSSRPSEKGPSNGTTPVRGNSVIDMSWAATVEAEEESHNELEDSASMYVLNSEKRDDKSYMEQRRWIRNARREVKEVFSKIEESVAVTEREEVEVAHHFNTEEQLKIHAQKRRLEDCGQRGQGEVLARGSYYMRKRMIYTMPWEPGFDTHRVLAKKIVVWLDLLNVDPMMEGLGKSLLSSLGEVLQVAGVTEKMEAKFANIRGCVLMDMTKALPSVLVLHMNEENPDDFSEVGKKGKQKEVSTSEVPSIPDQSNRFAVLEENDEEDHVENVLEDEAMEPTRDHLEKGDGNEREETSRRESSHGDHVGVGYANTGRGGRGTAVLAVQELKSRERQIDFNLRNIMAEALVVVDFAPNEIGGAALAIHESIKVRARGVKGTSNMAWVCVEIQGKEVYMASVYGPHGQDEKIAFYAWLRDMANGKNWILVGDWNMVLAQEDSSGPTPVLKGETLNVWGEVEIAWNMEDTYNIALQKVGQRFTRQAVRDSRLDQLRLDKAYVNKNAVWVKEVRQLTHDGNEALSDHSPVILEVNLDGSNAGRRNRKDLYTKMKVKSMRNPVRRKQILEAWEEG